MDVYWLLLGTLAVWRVTHLLVAEDGPWDIVVRARRRAGSGFWGRLLDCFYCLSLWIAAPLAVLLGATWAERVLLWLAMSGAAILLERMTRARGEAPPVTYVEHEEKTNGVLREQEEPGSRPGAGAPGV